MKCSGCDYGKMNAMGDYVCGYRGIGDKPCEYDDDWAGYDEEDWWDIGYDEY